MATEYREHVGSSAETIPTRWDVEVLGGALNYLFCLFYGWAMSLRRVSQLVTRRLPATKGFFTGADSLLGTECPSCPKRAQSHSHPSLSRHHAASTSLGSRS